MFKDTPAYEYCQKLIALKGQENRVFRLALDNRTIKELIVFLNTDEQMGEQHVDALGQSLFNRISESTTYSLFQTKKNRSRAGQPYKLYEYGNYWDSFQAIVGDGVITIDSNPMKGSDNIEDMFGEDLEGLTEESLKALIQQAYEFFIKWYREYLLR